jgi:ribosome biogenesis GTPase A
VASYAKPGVTRALQWVRLAGELDLLDAPGGVGQHWKTRHEGSYRGSKGRVRWQASDQER